MKLIDYEKTILIQKAMVELAGMASATLKRHNFLMSLMADRWKSGNILNFNAFLVSHILASILSYQQFMPVGTLGPCQANCPQQPHVRIILAIVGINKDI